MHIIYERIGMVSKQTVGWLRLHWRGIVYYAGVVLVLCAVAVAADAHRQNNKLEEIYLPAAEVVQVEAEECLPVLILPKNMRLLRAYSLEPAWNDALCQWENHPAADYAAKDGIAAAFIDGKIQKIGSNSRWGNYIEVVSGDLVLIYGSVSAEKDICEGDPVKAGEMLGRMDESMIREAYLASHLHLEARFRGESVDPQSYLNKEGKGVSNS